MKLFLMMAFVISNSYAATMYTFDGSFKPQSSIPYFYMTDFYNQYQYCYVGETNKACDLVAEGETITFANYTDGAHDYFEVLTCSNDHDQVTVKAKLYNDYDNDFREREVSFGQCD